MFIILWLLKFNVHVIEVRGEYLLRNVRIIPDAFPLNSPFICFRNVAKIGSSKITIVTFSKFFGLLSVRNLIIAVRITFDICSGVAPKNPVY